MDDGKYFEYYLNTTPLDVNAYCTTCGDVLSTPQYNTLTDSTYGCTINVV